MSQVQGAEPQGGFDRVRVQRRGSDVGLHRVLVFVASLVKLAQAQMICSASAWSSDETLEMGDSLVDSIGLYAGRDQVVRRGGMRIKGEHALIRDDRFFMPTDLRVEMGEGEQGVHFAWRAGVNDLVVVDGLIHGAAPEIDRSQPFMSVSQSRIRGDRRSIGLLRRPRFAGALSAKSQGEKRCGVVRFSLQGGFERSGGLVRFALLIEDASRTDERTDVVWVDRQGRLERCPSRLEAPGDQMVVSTTRVIRAAVGETFKHRGHLGQESATDKFEGIGHGSLAVQRLCGTGFRSVRSQVANLCHTDGYVEIASRAFVAASNRSLIISAWR